MRRLVPLLILALAPLAACGSDDEAATDASPRLAAMSAVAAPATSTTASSYEPVPMPFPSRAWLNRAEGALVVEDCGQADAFVASGHVLSEVVVYRSYACGPAVTSMVTSGRQSIAELFSGR